MHFSEGFKVPIGFSTNLKKLVSMKDLSITHYKAHDCHVMLTMFLSNCNQGYKARVLENGHHPHVLLLFKDLTEDDWQERAE